VRSNLFGSLQTFGNAVLGDAGFIVIYIMVVSTMFAGTHSGVLEASRQVDSIHIIPISESLFFFFLFLYYSLFIREMMVCSREGSMPKFLSGVHVTFKTPITALVFEVSTSWSKELRNESVQSMAWHLVVKYG